MATTTVRLDPEDEERLAALAPEYGGRSGALREGLRLLERAQRQRAGLAEFAREIEGETGGPITQAELDEAGQRWGL